jgi:hypothetical protein
LTTFDVVVIGDGGLQYVQALLEDVLQVPKKRPNEVKSGLGLGLRRGIGMFLSSGNQDTNSGY